MRRPILASLLCVSIIPNLALASDLGVVGPTYDIVERDLIEVMKDRFRRLEQTGEMRKLEDRYKAKVVEAVERPRPIQGITPTQTARTYFVDPTWTLDRNVLDEKGQVLFPAGTRVNPLDYAPMTQTLLFFDQRERSQVAFAKRFLAEAKARVKPILVGGEPLKLMRQWKREVFYDQGGVLSRKFLLQQVPALITQDGNRLRVDEIRP
jgi:conjugal transfer pilus assembly protein TraW